MRYSPVKFSVRGRDLASTIAEAQASIAREIPQCDKAPSWVKLCRPYDTRLEWGGEINELHEAEGRLAIIIPLTILLITFLDVQRGQELGRHGARAHEHPGRVHGRGRSRS